MPIDSRGRWNSFSHQLYHYSVPRITIGDPSYLLPLGITPPDLPFHTCFVYCLCSAAYSELNACSSGLYAPSYCMHKNFPPKTNKV